MIQYLIIGLVLFTVANHADYLLQAYQHGWWTWLDLSARATKWGLLDFIPHDAWHVVQWLRNMSMIIAPFFVAHFAAYRIRLVVQRYPTMWLSATVKWFYENRKAVALASIVLAYILTRGIAFSFIYKVMN